MDQDFFRQLREEQNTKRLAILGTVTEKSKQPKCKCGSDMEKHFTDGYYWCPLCNLLESELVTSRRLH